MMKTLEARLKTLLAAAPAEDLLKDRVEYHLITNDKDRAMPVGTPSINVSSQQNHRGSPSWTW